MKSSLAPIVLFVYNRPWHTLQTLEALAKNNLAGDSVLYIYADGPKDNVVEEQIKKIHEVRRFIRTKKWCKEVNIIENEKNKGLATSVIEGVTEIVNKYGKVIVLEDDLITSKGFLQYMNDALTTYFEEERVWHISGYWYPAKGSENLPKIFFFNAATCWGWGTWQRAWRNLVVDPIELRDKLLLTKDGIFHFNIENAYPFFDQLELNIDQTLSSWAIKWYGSIFLNKAYSLHPRQSLTNNIGCDGSGMNCEQSSIFYWPTLAEAVEVKKISIVESKKARKLLKPYFNREKFSGTFLNEIRRMIRFNITTRVKNTLLRLGIEVSRPKKDKYGDLISQVRYKEQLVSLLGRDFLIADARSFYYSYKEIFELEIYKFQAATDTPFIIDCGSNYGTSILYFKKMYPKCTIIGFEPDPYIFNILKRNILHYELQSVTLINEALWTEENTLSFFSEKADGGRLIATGDATIYDTIQVKTTFLSKYLQMGKIDFLKIDIEGAEVDVLVEAEKYLTNVSNIFIEYHSFRNKEQRLSLILSILTRNNFKYYLQTVAASTSPFMNVLENNIMDLQLNIFAVKN